jgi:hypothetical protein
MALTATTMSRPSPVISVVVPTVGRAPKLEASLAAYAGLDARTPPFDVVVIGAR